VIKNYIINSTILNLFVKGLNYIYYLLVSSIIGYGIVIDSITYIEGIVGFTVLLPLQIFNFTLIPKLKQDSANFNSNFSTILIFAIFWGLVWSLVYKFFLLDLISIFYPGLGSDYRDFIDENILYIVIFVSFVLMNNIMSISLDAIKKHTMVYKVLSVKSITSLVVFYMYQNQNSVLFMVLMGTTIVEFLFLISIYRKLIVINFNRLFLIEHLKDLKYILLFMLTGILFGIIDRYFISYLDSGSMSILKFSNLIIGMISGLIPISRILYPYLSISENNKHLDYFNKVLKVILAIYIPLLIFIFIFPNFIPKLLFGYGKITISEISQMGTSLFFLVPTAIFSILIGILDKILYLQKLYRALFYRLIATLIINGIGNFLSVFIFGWGLYGILFFTMLVHLYILYSSYIIIKKANK
jgi:peptidoglycan biosynthesis protein MviN/MurJ (putative lipid II flippase)